MKSLGYKLALAVSSLPVASTALAGLTVRLTTDDKPYWCDGVGWIDLTATGGGGGGVTASDTAPAIPHANPLWLNTLTMSMYYQYNDGTSTQWVDISVPPASMGGATGQVQFNNGGLPGGAGRVLVNDNDLVLANSATPSGAPAGATKLFGRSVAGRMIPAFVGPSGLDSSLQPLLARNKIAWWNPPGNSTTVPGVLGIAAPTAVGTASSRNVAVTNVLTRMKRLGYVTSTTAGSLCGHYNNTAQYTTGTGSGLGGFFYVNRFGLSDTSLQAAGRTFVGKTSSVAAPTNVEPSTLLNCIGVGNKANDANMSLFYGGSAAQTPIDLGSSFPVSITTAYELALFASPNEAGYVNWQVTNLGTGATVSGKVGDGTSTKLPSSATLLAQRAWRTNNTAAAVVGIDLCGFYIETDY